MAATAITARNCTQTNERKTTGRRGRLTIAECLLQVGERGRLIWGARSKEFCLCAIFYMEKGKRFTV